MAGLFLAVPCAGKAQTDLRVELAFASQSVAVSSPTWRASCSRHPALSRERRAPMALQAVWGGKSASAPGQLASLSLRVRVKPSKRAPLGLYIYRMPWRPDG